MSDSNEGEVNVQVDHVTIKGNLLLPAHPTGLVLFSHGSGSSRFSPRNMLVASYLRKAGLGTFLIDLLTPTEDSVHSNRFDIPLLSKRLGGVINWLDKNPDVRDLPLGLFGASTGAASALEAAAINKKVGAVVSRGGRPDLAMGVLDKVSAPTLLIVGGYDYDVIKLNEKAYSHMKCEKEFVIVPEATHLFEEPGKLEQVAEIAKKWFTEKLTGKK